MFEKEKFKNPQEIKEPEETTKKVELSSETDPKTGVVRTKEEFEKERRKKLDDPSRWRDLR